MLRKMKNDLSDIEIPPGLKLSSVERVTIGETNDVYRCKGEFHARTVDAYVKIAKQASHCLSNEKAVLDALVPGAIPAPRVLWYGETPKAILVVESLPGHMVWDYIDPRRSLHDKDKAPTYLQAYGRCLAAIHNLPLPWASQKRARLCNLIGEESVEDEGFVTLVSWLQEHAPQNRDEVFVHGDLNTASVLFCDDSLSGVIDWEFAGRGWREYDLAWVLRARTAFLNTLAERSAILEGYREHASYDEDALRWCEVLNYLHFAYWSKEEEPAYTSFAIEKACELAEL